MLSDLSPGIGHNGGPPIAWGPIPGTSQEMALTSPANQTLFTGARGPGKTDTQLMHFRQFVGRGYGRFWRGVLFDREYKMLDDIVSKTRRWFPKFNDGARFLESKSDYKWVWPSGEELLFRHMEKEDDYWTYHGQEFPWIGWNELCKYPTLACYDMMMSCNRSSFTRKDAPIDMQTGEPIDVPPIPLRVFSTTNSYGPGHNAVKRRFILPAEYGELLVRETEVFNPQTQKEEIIQTTQVAIFGSWRENIYLPPQYVAELAKISDPNLRAAWEKGSWDIVSGGALDDLFRNNVHVVPRFRVPDNWQITRTLDWGSTHPFAYGLWAEANGETVELPNGQLWTPQPGSYILVGELYGTQEIGTNRGVKWSPTKVAEEIEKFEAQMIGEGWVPDNIWPGPADNQIRDVREADVPTIEAKMAAVGITFTQSDKSRGSRKIGLQLVRDRLEAATRREGAGLYFMAHCVASIETVPAVPRDPVIMDDVDTTSEDHLYDMVRYKVLSGNTRLVGSIEQRFAT